MEGKQGIDGVPANVVASVGYVALDLCRDRRNGRSLVQRHITGFTTLVRLCGRPHNRSLTIAPRRYKDEKTGEWRDAGSLRTTDVPSLVLALEAAHRFMLGTPLPGQSIEEEPIETVVASGNGAIPF